MGNEAKVLRTKSNHETAILGELMGNDVGVKLVETAAASIAEAQGSRDYTPEGKRNASLRALQAARAGLREHEDEFARRRGVADDLRAEILHDYGGDTVNTEDIREARQEIRRRCGDDPVKVGMLLQQAIEKGDTTTACAILETRNTVFPMVDAQRIEVAEEQVVAKSPRLDELTAALSSAEEVGGVVGAVRRDLEKLAHGAGLDEEWRAELHRPEK